MRESTHKFPHTHTLFLPTHGAWLTLFACPSSRRPKDSRTTGKQLTGGQLRHENSKINPGTFEAPKLLWAEQKDKYADCIRYKEMFPAEKKKSGFLSSDFPRRDEFSNTIRTEQIREVLKVRKSAAMQTSVPEENGC